MKVWSVRNQRTEHEFGNSGISVYDLVIGREGTPLANLIVFIGQNKTCRVFNSKTSVEIRTINLDSYCMSIAVDETQTMIVVGTDEGVTFIETTNFTKVKEVFLNNPVNSLAFNKRNDCMLAVTKKGEVHAFNF